MAEPAPAFLNNGVTAHRGSSTAFPENTLAAFEDAIRLGADWVELDIRETADGQILVCHDATTRRTGDRDLEVAKSTYTELSQVDVGTDFRRRNGLDLAQCPPARMPLLKEVLVLFMKQNRTRVSLQPKDGCTEAAVQLLRETGALAWAGFNDGSLEKMSLVKKLEPGLPVFWDRPARGDLTKDVATALERGFEALVLEHSGLTGEKVRQILAAGLEAGGWTVNDEAEMRLLLSLGVRRLYTDDPALLLRLRAEASLPKGKAED